MGEAWTESQEGISVFFFAFSALLAVVLVLSVSEGFALSYMLLALSRPFHCNIDIHYCLM